MEMVSLKIGPPQRPGGEEWSLKDQTEIVLIRISHDATFSRASRSGIRSLQLLYLKDGQLSSSDIIGDKSFGGPSFQEFKLDYPAEYITGVEGNHNASDQLSVLIIETNRNKYGPFGSESGYRPFSLKFGPENKFGGFHGIHDSSCVGSIGFYLNPTTFSPPLPAAGPRICPTCLRQVSDDNDDDDVDNQVLKID